MHIMTKNGWKLLGGPLSETPKDTDWYKRAFPFLSRNGVNERLMDRFEAICNRYDDAMLAAGKEDML